MYLQAQDMLSSSPSCWLLIHLMRWYQFQKKTPWEPMSSDWCPIDRRPSLLYDVSHLWRTKGVSLTFPNHPSTSSSPLSTIIIIIIEMGFRFHFNFHPMLGAPKFFYCHFGFYPVTRTSCHRHRRDLVLVSSKSYAAFPTFRIGLPQLAWKWDATIVISPIAAFIFLFVLGFYVLGLGFRFHLCIFCVICIHGLCREVAS